MEIPPILENENLRIEALKKSQLLESKKEAIFDNLTSLVSKSFQVPVVALSLIDDARQWFKSIHGLNISETSREISFCGHVVYQGLPLIVSNAHEDPRFYDNPLVTEAPKITFYVGVPLRYYYKREIYCLGTICLIDYVIRNFSDDDLEMLQSFAFQIEALIEMRLPAQKFQQLSQKLSNGSIQPKDLKKFILD